MAQTTFIPASAMTLRPAGERGLADHGWLKSRHSFSFARYHDPAHMGFQALRVINDDRVAGGGGFPTHPHRDAEIFSYILEGALSHRDTTGTASTVRAGGVQFMTTGSGVSHSEFNASRSEPVHFLQVWLLPDVRGATPRYENLDIAPEEKDGRLRLFLSGAGASGAIRTHAPAEVYAATLRGEQSIDFPLREGRSAWIQVARGSLAVNDLRLEEGDGLAVTRSGLLRLSGGQDAEILLFDLEAQRA